MMHIDTDAGRITSDDGWRATLAAHRRIAGKQLELLVFPRRTHVIHLANGHPVATLKYIRRQWLLSMEGFEFWNYNRVLGKEHYTAVLAFHGVDKAHAFVRKILGDCEATI
jgi:hypothetical protein